MEMPSYKYIKEQFYSIIDKGYYSIDVVNGENDVEALDKSNEFYYNPADGNLTIALATFSEVALVADTENAWNGEYDYSWYTNAVALADGESAAVYTIANAD